MIELNRRDFLKKLGIGATGLALSGTLLSLSSCANNDQGTEDSQDIDYVAIRVSSDVYKSSLLQRFAFVVFKNEEHLSSETLTISLKKPDGSVEKINNVKPRSTGLKTQGIYSFETSFAEAGQYEMNSIYKDKKISLAFNVAETNLAPGLDTQALKTISPTTADPKDAKILCTRFEGECGLHQSNIADYLALNEPLIVMFATPARCQTSYCGPVLELLKNELMTNKINAVHIEIYKDETSPTTLDAVTEWGLPSEPWLFAIDKTGKIVKRLDGAFDLSEIKESIAAAQK